MDYVHAYIVIAKNWETLTPLTNPGWVGRHYEIQSLYHVTALGLSKRTFMLGHRNKIKILFVVHSWSLHTFTEQPSSSSLFKRRLHFQPFERQGRTVYKPCVKTEISCLHHRPHYSARPMHFRSCGPTEFSFWIRHRNTLTKRAWKDTVQAPGQEISRISRYTLNLVTLLSFVFLIEEEGPQPRLVILVFSRKTGVSSAHTCLLINRWS